MMKREVNFMNRVYSLRGRRTRSGRRHPLLVLSLLLLALLLVFNFQLHPSLAAMATAAAERRAVSLVAAAFSAEIAEESVGYGELIAIAYRDGGYVASVSLNTARLNAVRNRLLLAVTERLSDTEVLTVRLPLGTVLGGDLFSGRGPDLEMRVLLAQGSVAYMESEFYDVGINQSLHRVLFTVELHLTVMLPTKPVTLTLKERFPVAETVIVGEVPDAYTAIDRLTDAVTEEDINDIYDFGAAPL